jgi:hypothetical protein
VLVGIPAGPPGLAFRNRDPRLGHHFEVPAAEITRTSHQGFERSVIHVRVALFEQADTSLLAKGGGGRSGPIR